MGRGNQCISFTTTNGLVHMSIRKCLKYSKGLPPNWEFHRWQKKVRASFVRPVFFATPWKSSKPWMAHFCCCLRFWALKASIHHSLYGQQTEYEWQKWYNDLPYELQKTQQLFMKGLGSGSLHVQKTIGWWQTPWQHKGQNSIFHHDAISKSVGCLFEKR